MDDIKNISNKKKKKKLLYLLSILLLAALLSIGGRFIFWVYAPNSRVAEKEAFLYIRTGADFREVCDSLSALHCLKNSSSFQWVANRKNYVSRVKPGRYLIVTGMSNNTLINRLRSGEQSAIRLIFNNIRSKSQLAGRISRQLEIDSTALLQLLNSPEVSSRYGLNQENILTLFIPNTYQIYWNTSAEKFLSRMFREYQKFWNRERMKLAEEKELTAQQVSILASIVEMETNRNDEKSKVAGVYLNRLKQGIALEADPTLLFALGDRTIQRVLKKDLQLESPYNTYKYKGLPPGPITLPSISSLDAVLHADHHDYLFFCARADLSGYHHFSKTLAQHQVYARAYQAALNRLNIKR